MRFASGEVVDVDGRGNRDHSWGFRDDFGFRHHHWINANFEALLHRRLGDGRDVL